MRKWREIARVESGSGSLYVIERGNMRALSPDANFWLHHSRVQKDKPQELFSWYQHAMLCAHAFTTAERVLSVGLGAGAMTSVSCALSPSVISIEKNPAMLQAAVQHFGFQHQYKVVITDVLDYDPPHLFDLIQIDITSAYPTVPKLYSTATFQRYKSWLDKHGILVLNLTGRQEIFNNIYRRLLRVFSGRCILLTAHPSEPVVICFARPRRIDMDWIQQRKEMLNQAGVLASEVLDPLFDERFYERSFTTPRLLRG